jgi:hypothetical protein
MKTSLLILALSLTAFAQEIVPLEEAQRGARKLTDVLGIPGDAPFALEVDVTKPQAIKGGGAGLLVIPDKGLTLEKLDATGSAITPLGQLWTLNVSLAKDGRPAPNERLRFHTLSTDTEDLRVQLYYLGAQKNADGKLDLVVFAKDKEPFLRQPLTLNGQPASQTLPIELGGRKDDEETGTLSLHFLGKYDIDLTVKKPAE